MAIGRVRGRRRALLRHFLAGPTRNRSGGRVRLPLVEPGAAWLALRRSLRGSTQRFGSLIRRKLSFSSRPSSSRHRGAHRPGGLQAEPGPAQSNPAPVHRRPSPGNIHDRLPVLFLKGSAVAGLLPTALVGWRCAIITRPPVVARIVTARAGPHAAIGLHVRSVGAAVLRGRTPIRRASASRGSSRRAAHDMTDADDVDLRAHESQLSGCGNRCDAAQAKFARREAIIVISWIEQDPRLSPRDRSCSHRIPGTHTDTLQAAFHVGEFPASLRS